jgi:hypothetical protein
MLQPAQPLCKLKRQLTLEEHTDQMISLNADLIAQHSILLYAYVRSPRRIFDCVHKALQLLQGVLKIVWQPFFEECGWSLWNIPIKVCW